MVGAVGLAMASRVRRPLLNRSYALIDGSNCNSVRVVVLTSLLTLAIRLSTVVITVVRSLTVIGVHLSTVVVVVMPLADDHHSALLEMAIVSYGHIVTAYRVTAQHPDGDGNNSRMKPLLSAARRDVCVCHQLCRP